MAVPRQRTTKSKRNQRRSHDAIKVPQLIKIGSTVVSRRLSKATKLGLIDKAGLFKKS